MKALLMLLLCAGSAMVAVTIPVLPTAPMQQEAVPSATASQEVERVTNKTSRAFNALKQIFPQLTFNDNCMHFHFGFICHLKPGSLERLDQKIKVDNMKMEPLESAV
ncbi:hypothetical protein chiPu_0013446 [Chiloscyllium punctatum]|uniref:Uncharacterized protein n=1 Tax=Chiloscyllium punctatum TaxID=137246 RepID=A0A401SX39_CHIPU|nr:hypothetical protein [Chiloscyllium punctatum]